MRLVLVSIFLFQLAIRASSQQQSPETCQALLDATSGSSFLSGCTTSTDCTSVTCSASSYDLTLTLTLLPCHTPIAVRVIAVDSSGTELLNEVVDESQTISIDTGVSAEITLNQVDGGIRFEVNIMALFTTIPIFRSTVIPIDTTSCQVATATTEEATTEAATTVQPTATSPSQQQSPETCQALRDATSGSSLLTECTTNTDCTSVTCSVPTFSLTLTLTLLPCHTPIAVRVIAVDSSGREEVNEVVDESQTINIDDGTDAEITLNQVDGGIVVGVIVSTPLGSTTIVPNTMIPVDTSFCQEMVTQSSAVQPTTSTAAPHVTMTVEPSTEPTIATTAINTEPLSGSFETTCEALRDVVASSEKLLAENGLGDLITCSTNKPTGCDTIVCTSSLLGTMNVAILRCTEPPGIKFEFVDSNGEVDSRTFTSSAVTSDKPVAGRIVLNITLDQFTDAIGLQVTAQLASSSSGPVFPIVEYAVIPLEKDKCEDGNDGSINFVSPAGFAAFLSFPLLITALLN